MLRTMVSQLIQHDRLETTLPKAKELRRIADKVVGWGKEVSTALRWHSQARGLRRVPADGRPPARCLHSLSWTPPR